MRRWTAAALALLLVVWGRSGLVSRPREMGELALVRVMGVDAEAGGTALTVSTGARGQRAPLTLTATGPGLSAAAQAAQSAGESRLYYGHADELLLGERAAEETLGQMIDCLCRERAQSLGAQIWVIRGGTARAAMEARSGADVCQRLEVLAADSRSGRSVPGRTVLETAGSMAAGESFWLPALTLDGEGQLARDGYAVVRDGRVVTFLEGDAALGLEPLQGYGQGRIDTLDLPDGSRAGFVLERAGPRVHPVFSGNEVTGMEIRLELVFHLTQSDRPLDREDQDWIERELGILEGQRAVRTLEMAQYWDADFLGLLARCRLAAPGRAGTLTDQWKAAFRTLDIRVEAQCRTERG